jgi:dTDP-4-amino-4,6-dideoxygalactose transaminase
VSAPETKDFLPFHRPAIGAAEIEAVARTLASGWLTTGPQVMEFEKQFAEQIGTRFVEAQNSCTAGLHLILDALGLGEGDEVLVPTVTFAATAATVLHTGAIPRLVDCDPVTLNIDLEDAARKCGPRTRAVIPVHMAGHPCPMDEIQALADRHGLRVVEDSAHALPASYRGRNAGSLGDAAAFSFYATKNLTTGEGGMVTTDDEQLRDLIVSRRLHGMNRDAWKRYTPGAAWRYDISYPGFKYNMTDSAAAMGLVQLNRLESMQARRRELVERYHKELSEFDAIELPVCLEEVESAWHLYAIRIRVEQLAIDRDRVMELLKEAGIGTSVHFIPLHQHSYYRDTMGYADEPLPNADAAADRILSLPLFPDMTFDDVSRVSDALSQILAAHRR